MKKIKIAEFVGSMNCGGAETMLMNILRNIDKQKYEITFIENVNEKCWYDDEIIKLGGKIIKIEKRNIYVYIKNLIHIFKENNFDIVHSHTYLHSGIIMYAAKKAKINIRITHSHSNMDTIKHNIIYKIKKILMQKLILKYSTIYLACSKEAGISLFGDKFNNKGIILHNPIDIYKIYNVSNKNIEKLKEKYNISSTQIIIGHVGRIIEIKNHKFLIEVAKILRKRNIDFKMFFIGDGNNFEVIKKSIYDNELQDYIIMTGNIKNVYEYLNLFDIFLMPSFYEGLPLAAIEAQAAGVNCILSNNISSETDIGIGIVKFLALNNIDQWIEQILIYGKKKKIDKYIIKDKIIQEKYDIESIINQLEILYN